jgi:predicted MFS family arabinose efflux permease
MSEPAGEASASPPHRARITRGEWALILVLVAIHFTHMVDFVIIMPLGGRLMRELELTPGQFGNVVSAYAWAAGLASLFASLVMDRFDRRTVLLTMYGGFGLSTLFCGLAPNYELLLVSRTLAGVFGGLAAVAIMTVIGDVFPVEKRGRATGAVISSFAVASIVGLPIGLLLAEWFGRGAPFVALAGLSGLIWVVGWFRLPRVRGHLGGSRPSAVREFAAVAREPRHLWAFVFSFFLVLGTFTIGAFVGPVLASANGWSEQQLAIIYLAAGLFTLIGMNVVGRLADRLPRLGLFRVLAFGALVTGLVVTNLPPVSLWVATLAISGFMVFASGRIIPAQAMLLGTAVPKNRGGFMSLNTAVQHLATGVAPAIGGALITQTADGKLTGFPLVGLVAAGAAAASLALAGWIRPAPHPTPAPVPEPTPTTEPATEPAAV